VYREPVVPNGNYNRGPGNTMQSGPGNTMTGRGTIRSNGTPRDGANTIQSRHAQTNGTR
jgi:hypothetical protein